MTGLQKKVIAKILSDRVQYWAWSVKNPKYLKNIIELSTANEDAITEADKQKIRDFQAILQENVLISGGAIASMLLGDEINDIDLYFLDKRVAGKVAQYYLNEMLDRKSIGDNWRNGDNKIIDNDTNGIAIYIKSQGVASEDLNSNEYEYFETVDENMVEKFFQDCNVKATTVEGDEKKHKVAFMTSNAISLTNGIQLIFRFCGSAEEIHRNFDFVHCMNYWTKESGLVYNPDALQALLEKRLVYNGSLFPVAAMFRLRKFVGRGYRISAGEMTKIAFDISKLDLSIPSVLKEQLMGCDIAYFNQVIVLLKEGEKEGRTLDRTYLFELINRVFNDHDVEADTKEGG